MTATKKRGRIENLRPWKPGQSGNPGGRPKKTPLTDALREVIEREAKGGGTIAEKLAEVAVIEALAGSRQHFQEIADRIEGKPRISIAHTGADGGPISVIHAELDQRIAELLDRGQDRASAAGGESGTPAAPREEGPAEVASGPS